MKWLKIYKGTEALINLDNIATVEVTAYKDGTAQLSFYTNEKIYYIDAKSKEDAQWMLKKIESFLEDPELKLLHLY